MRPDERVLKNKYVFDYNIVVKLCPEYKEYVTDIMDDDGDEDLQAIITLDNALHPHHDIRRNDKTTDEEMDIINMMHDDPSAPQQENPPRQRHRYEMSQAMSRHVGSTDTNYVLKAPYRYYPNRPQKMDVPQLMPPKTVLGVGSVLWVGENVHYTIESSKSGGNVVTAIRRKLTNRVEENKIRLLRVSFWFDRVKNVMVEDKEHTKCTVYNKKTTITDKRLIKTCNNISLVSRTRICS